MPVVDDIRARLDIVELISAAVPLQKNGRNFKAICPFHTEKTPSFIVNPERQTWRCFGACATGGDIFNFVMRKDGVEFGEALRRLADAAGVEIAPRPKEQVDHEEALLRVNDLAARFYHEMLRSSEGEPVIAYLYDRGIDDKTIDEFMLGYSPKGSGSLRSHLSSLDANLEHATQAGLLRSDESGAVRDFFYGRLMAPIYNPRGRVAGFGGRSMDGSNPKYINTPATPVFDKQAMLYGMEKAVPHVRDEETVVIVEGYMDVIAAHQHGYKNVVASMGTALTERQVSLVRSLAKTVVLALDADAAGQEATLRSLEVSWQAMERRRRGQRQQIALRIANLPNGRDPDDIIRQSPEQWRRVVGSAVPYMDFLITALVGRHDVSTPEGKARAAESLMPMIVSMGNAFEQDRYFDKLANAIGVTRDALQASVGKLLPSRRERAPTRGRGAVSQGPSVSPLAASNREPLEEYVLAILVKWPELKEEIRDHLPEEFTRTENREMFTCIFSASTIEELRQHLDETLLDHLEYLSRIDLTHADRRSGQTAVLQALTRLRQRYLRDRQAEILESVEIDPSAPWPKDVPKDVEESILEVNSRLKDSYRAGARAHPLR